MPPLLHALAGIALLPDGALARTVEAEKASLQVVLYDLLRHEQALASAAQPAGRSEADRVLDLTQAAYGELVGLLIGRSDELLETTRDGEWTLRDLLRHAIAVELRYAAQVEWAATRGHTDPLPIPEDRLPCDRLAPPEPDFAGSRTGGLTQVLELLGEARRRSDEILTSIPDVALARPSLWGTLQMTVRMRLHQTAAHLTEVVVQAEKCLGPRLDVEARRILRNCVRIRGSHERWSARGARAALDTRYAALVGITSREI